MSAKVVPQPDTSTTRENVAMVGGPPKRLHTLNLCMCVAWLPLGYLLLALQY